MGEFPTRKHSDEIIAAIVLASQNGLTGAAIHRALAAGSLPTWQDGAYDIPIATVNYFVRMHKKKAAAHAGELSERMRGDMHAAIDGMAREIATELEVKLKKERSKRNGPDIDALAKIAAVAAKVKPLLRETPTKPDAGPRRDPFADKLRKAAAKPKAPKPALEPVTPDPTPSPPWAQVEQPVP